VQITKYGSLSLRAQTHCVSPSAAAAALRPRREGADRSNRESGPSGKSRPKGLGGCARVDVLVYVAAEVMRPAGRVNEYTVVGAEPNVHVAELAIVVLSLRGRGATECRSFAIP